MLTSGSATGQQTAIFIYDGWDPSQGLEAGHTSSQVILPAGGQVFIAGGDNGTRSSTTR